MADVGYECEGSRARSSEWDVQRLSRCSLGTKATAWISYLSTVSRIIAVTTLVPNNVPLYTTTRLDVKLT